MLDTYTGNSFLPKQQKLIAYLLVLCYNTKTNVHHILGGNLWKMISDS